MQPLFRRSTTILAAFLFVPSIGWAQLPQPGQSDAVRVMVTMNADGSRTEYKFDDAKHKAVATTTNPDGKLREKIRYELDDAGRWSSGRIFGPDRRFRFKSRYKYDSAGRMEEEIQMNDKDIVLHKIVYSYDQNGKQTGYSIFDANGKLESGTTASTPTTSPKSREKK